MSSILAPLSEPLKLGELKLPTRNFMAPLTRTRCVPTNVPNDHHVEYYTQRAKGGAGLLISEAVLVSPQGSEWPHAPGLWSDEQVVAWKKVTDAVHAHGGYIFVQLMHVGRLGHPDMPEQGGKPVVGPSAIAAHGGKFRLLPGQPGYVKPSVLEDPWTVVEEFRHAAVNAKTAGFDGVELHAAGGHIVHQFLDSNSNKRTDQWGGSIENRCRFGLAVTKAIVEVLGAGRVGTKISPCGGYNDVGMSLPETIQTFTHYITQLAHMGIGYIQLLRYSSSFDFPAAPEAQRSIRQVEDAAPQNQYKRGTPHDVLAIYGPLVKVPLATLAEHKESSFRGPAMPAPDCGNPTPTRLLLNGGLSPDEAATLLNDGLIDAAVFGTMWISNPDFQRRLELGKELNKDVDMSTLYDFPEGCPEKGYTDYPYAT